MINLILNTRLKIWHLDEFSFSLKKKGDGSKYPSLLKSFMDNIIDNK